MACSIKLEMGHAGSQVTVNSTSQLPSKATTAAYIANINTIQPMPKHIHHHHHHHHRKDINSLQQFTHNSSGEVHQTTANSKQQQCSERRWRRRDKQKLRTLLYELLAITTTAATVNATPIAYATTTTTTTTTTYATTGIRLIPLRTALGSTNMPTLETNVTTLLTALSMVELPTLASNLNAVTDSVATAKAFIQMNFTAYRAESVVADAAPAAVLVNNIATTTPRADLHSINATFMSATYAPACCAVSSIYAYLSALPWPNAFAVAIFVILFLVTVAGNLLVIVSVLTTRRLRTVTNCFVLNLAITDLLVGLFVMPPAVILYVVGSWHFGWILCDIWISLDVLLCTGSILSLCAISLDRYLAVTQPLTYSKKRRSKRLALFMILIVWVTALLITCPPYFGWYEKAENSDGKVNCRYNQNKGYVVFSAMGSFFIPLAVMMYVYLKIGYVLKSRRQRIVRDANSERVADHDLDCDNFISESEHYHCITPKCPSLKSRWCNTNGGNNICSPKQLSFRCAQCNNESYASNINKPNAFQDGLMTANIVADGLKHQATFYELVEVSHLTSIIQCTSLNCKYGGACVHSTGLITTPLNGRRSNSLPMGAVHLMEDSLTFTENCLANKQITNTSVTTTTTQSMKINHYQQQKQQQHSIHQHHHDHEQHHEQHHEHHHQHQHQHQHQHTQSNRSAHSHRIPMRISTAKKGDTKAAKTLTTVMGGFIACWLPFFVYYLLKPFLPPAVVSEGLMSFFTWVGWVNCAINPFIYAFYNPDFRTAFRRIACKIICKRTPPSNHLAMFRG